MTARDRFLPWSAYVLGGAGWFVSQQWGSSRVIDDCLHARPWQSVVLGLLGLALALFGGLLSCLGLLRSPSPLGKFIARVGVAADCVFMLAILFHTSANLLIPRCFS